jgi:hypothetical protein
MLSVAPNQNRVSIEEKKTKRGQLELGTDALTIDTAWSRAE